MEPESECQEVDSETEYRKRGSIQQKPVRWHSERDIAKLINLEERKRQREKCRPDESQRKSEGGHGEDENISEQNKNMMQWNDAFPAEAREECDAFVFFVLREGLKIKYDEICKSEEGQRNGQREKGMCLAGLQCERKSWKDICRLNCEEQFAEATIDESERRRGINKNDDEREN